MKLRDLKDIISPDCKVGLTDRQETEIPIVDTWKNWINGGLKTLDVDVCRIDTVGYLLLVLDLEGD